MNDLVYNEMVTSPGFELEFAVGTTYSLDAEIFLALSLAFAGLGDIIEADSQNPIRLLEGLRQATNRMAIFCNRGGLQLPVRKNPLYAMLDKCVFEVSDSKEPLANFHPKIWIIKERSIENREFRQLKLIVLSRNLTKDTSIDVAVSMIAPLGVRDNAEIRQKHEPLKHVLEELANYASADKRKKIKQLVKDINTLGRFELDKKYVDYDFIPLHFGKNLNQNVDFRKELPGQKMIIVSPFIDKTEKIINKGCEEESPVSWLNEYAKNQEKVLITRLESLTPEIMDIYAGEKREVWVMSPIVKENDIQPMNLHAKMYFSRSNRKGETHLWLGSANATHSGFYRNSEFLLRLTLKRGQNQFQTFKNIFCDEETPMCMRITSLSDTSGSVEKDYTLVVKVRRNLIRANNLISEVTPTDNGYQIKISARKIKDIPGIIKIAPIQQPNNEGILSPENKECILTVSQPSDISEFYILSVHPFEGYDYEPVKIVIKIPTKGIPDDRDDIIFRSFINSREKFLNYVEMMVTDHPLELSILLSERTEGSIGSKTSVKQGFAGSAAIYESLLRTAATNPDKLEDIQDLMNRLDKDVVPESFRQMAGMFKSSLKKLR